MMVACSDGALSGVDDVFEACWEERFQDDHCLGMEVPKLNWTQWDDEAGNGPFVTAVGHANEHRHQGDDIEVGSSWWGTG